MTIVSLQTAPVSWQEIKDFTRADSDLDQALLLNLAKMATDEFISLSGYIPADAMVLVTGYLGTLCVAFTPLPAPTTVTVDGTVLAPAKYTWDPVSNTITPAADVTGQVMEVTFTVTNAATTPNDVKLAILQKTKEAYEYGDNLEWKGVRAFDRIAWRYRSDFAN
jgi:hypothetical protein